MGLKIAVIGGGSTYTPELVEGLADRAASLPVDELVLHDIDGDRLAIVAGLARAHPRPAGLARPADQHRPTGTSPSPSASFVLVQLRVGGQAARFTDETLPHRFGCIGQETTGPGGFAKALRTVPVVLALADDVARRRSSRRLDRRLHEPRRDRHPGAARRRPPGDRAVQRRDRDPAPDGGPVRASHRIGSSSSTSASTT